MLVSFNAHQCMYSILKYDRDNIFSFCSSHLLLRMDDVDDDVDLVESQLAHVFRQTHLDLLS